MHRALARSTTSLVLAALVGLLAGLASALFLTLLDRATELREARVALVWALPLAGLALGEVLARWGKPIDGGTDLVVEALHAGGALVPRRLAPLVLFGTVFTHLFGGSAGREGTAVQMGASLADGVSRALSLDAGMRRALLAAGVAGGFGSVFGTPLAGLVFALEVAVIGRWPLAALGSAAVAAFVGDAVTRGVGVAHTAYPQVASVPLTPSLAARWLVFAVAVALTSVAFIELTHLLKRIATARIPRRGVRLAVGGALVVLLWQCAGTDAYLGLGVPGILRAFTDPALPMEAFALKLLFTAVTVGFGFLGGEVTPLFFVGASLGSVMARLLGLPLELGAGVGLAAVFAASSNTPVALTLMSVELLGIHVLPHVAIVCFVAFLLTGHRSIYRAQRVHRGKHGLRHATPRTLAEARLRGW